MPERRNIHQENAARGPALAVASSELPTVGSNVPRSRNLRHKASRSASSLRAALATLACVAAVAVLVSFCSRVYARHAVQHLGTRRLASSDDSPASACKNSGDEEQQQQRQNPGPSSLPDLPESALPPKKRLAARLVQLGADGDGHSFQQPENQQHDREPAAASLALSPTEVAPRPAQFGFPPFPVRSPVPSAQRQPQPDLDTAGGLQSLPHSQHPTGSFVLGASHTASQWTQMLQQRLDLLQRQQEGRRQHYQQQQEIFQQQQHASGQYRHQQQHHSLYWGSSDWWFLQWQQLQQQQTTPQLQGGQQLVPPQGSQPGAQDEGLLQQQRQDVMWQGVREQRDKQAKRKRHEEGEAEDGKQHASAFSPYNESIWLSSGIPRHQIPQPSTSQQALHSSAAPTALSPWRAEHMLMLANPGFPSVRLAAPATSAFAEASRDEGAAARAAWDAAACAAAALHNRVAGLSSAPSTIDRAGTSVEVTALSTFQAAACAECARRAAPATAAGSAAPSSAPLAATTGMPESPGEDYGHHPFVRLPRPIPSPGSPPRIDFKRAVSSVAGMRDGVSLLLKVRQLLGRAMLFPVELKDLTLVTTLLMAHLMHHQKQDLSLHLSGHALERLGLRFLMLDAVVSSMIVLGQTPNPEDWKRFVDSIGHAAPLPVESGVGRPNLTIAGARELSDALQTLKTGRRPDPPTIVKLKRMLLCSSSAPSRFKRPIFDPWRQDDDMFSSGQ